MRTPIHKACHALCWGDDAHPVSHGCVLRQDGDAPLLLQCVGVHDALLHDLIRAKHLRARRVLLACPPRARDSARLLAIQKNHSASRAPAAAVRRAGGKPAPRSRQARLAGRRAPGKGQRERAATLLCFNMESTSVVLPWSTCAMMAMLRMSSRTDGRSSSASPDELGAGGAAAGAPDVRLVPVSRSRARAHRLLVHHSTAGTGSLQCWQRQQARSPLQQPH